MKSQELQKTKGNKGKKVYVGMSGGVDSSVSAALLQKAGYNVTGVFIKVWQPDWLAGTSSCTWREDRLDAMRVAARLQIPFITLDLEKEYKKEVVDYMISEYKLGRTPNPDVMCNRFVKFGGFFTWAMKQGADFVATGHYARVKKDYKGLYMLLSGDDQNKDQSYFLWTLTQEQLSKTLFPVGNIEKPQVRRLAKKFKLPNAEKKDSQGLCFIGKIDVKEFLSHYIPLKKGNVLNESGEIIGEHDGAFFYTLGERHGFTITKKTPHDERYYVVGKDIKKNTITVSNKENISGVHNKIKIDKVNWTAEIPKVCEKVSVRARYRQSLIKAEIESIKDQTVTLSLKVSIDFITPGQSLVIYDGEVCLGGGIIDY